MRFALFAKIASFQIVLSLLLMPQISDLSAQTNAQQLDSQEKKELIEKISALLRGHYVFPDLGEKYGQEILSLFEARDFNNISDSKKFGEYVTDKLQELTKDKHVKFRLIEPSDLGESEEGSLHHPVRYYRLGRKEHLGITRLDWIENEIGYMDYRRFYYHAEAKEMLFNAIKFLSTANAIIIDLRENQGGGGALIPWFCSYFMPHPTPLTGTYYRDEDMTEEWWTLEKIEGQRLLDVPMFVLIGKNTFSAAEYLAYDLKIQKRATLIGEPSKGGAHSVDLFPVGDRFEIYIPTARAVNPITGSNWEGTGVIPDVAVPSESALDTAVELAKKAAQEYGKLKDARMKEIVVKMQGQLDQAELLYKKEKMNVEEAEALLDSAIHTGSEAGLINEFFLQVLAYHYSSHQAFDMATRILKKQVELFPRSPGSYQSLGWAYYRQGEKELAIEYFEKVLELDKDNSIAKAMLKKLK